MAKTTYVLDRLLLDAIRNGVVLQNTRESVAWFNRRAGKVKDSKSRMIKEANKSRKFTSIQPGDMMFFRYDAKHKGTLPYWDALPLVVPFSEDADSFLAINLHYAPPKARAVLLDHLLHIASDTKYNKQTKLNLSYEYIKAASRNKYFKPTIKKYLKSHVMSEFVKVEAIEWPAAMFLPLQSFKKASAQKVYADYRKAVK